MNLNGRAALLRRLQHGVNVAARQRRPTVRFAETTAGILTGALFPDGSSALIQVSVSSVISC